MRHLSLLLTPLVPAQTFSDLSLSLPCLPGVWVPVGAGTPTVPPARSSPGSSPALRSGKLSHTTQSKPAQSRQRPAKPFTTVTRAVPAKSSQRQDHSRPAASPTRSPGETQPGGAGRGGCLGRGASSAPKLLAWVLCRAGSSQLDPPEFWQRGTGVGWCQRDTGGGWLERAGAAGWPGLGTSPLCPGTAVAVKPSLRSGL